MDAPAIFDWDNAKAEGNLSKHGVRFGVASTVFKDPRLVIVETVRVQDGEDRQKAVGMIAGRLFTVVFVMRDGVCRIISARRANAGEERAYG